MIMNRFIPLFRKAGVYSPFRHSPLFLVGAFLVAGLTLADPIDARKARETAAAYVDRNYAAGDQRQTSPKVQVAELPKAGNPHPIEKNGNPVGYVVPLSPHGYVLIRSDDELPPVKLHSPTENYGDLPPVFRRLIETELRGEVDDLKTLKGSGTPVQKRYKQEWIELSSPAKGADGDKAANMALTTTAWNQGFPYNLFMHEDSGRRTLAGCGAIALAQLLRFHQQPRAPRQDHTWTDSAGRSTGTYKLSDYGLYDYAWNTMPSSVSSDGPASQQLAVGVLVYHCAVAIDSNFETNSTGSNMYSVRDSLNPIFDFTHTGLKTKSNASAWYAMIMTDIDAGLPIYYGMWESDGGNGHAVVCDGYRNGSEIHLNLGWSASYNTWYNMNTVSASRYQWTRHSAITGIRPNSAVQAGSVQVTLNPQGAVSAGAQWMVDSGSWKNSDATVSGLAVGSHTVSFRDIAGYTTPGNKSVSVRNGETTATSGTYERHSGSLSVTLRPAGAVAAGAQWMLDGGDWQNSGATLSGLTVGSHTVSFKTASGFTKPDNLAVEIRNGQLNSLSGEYIKETIEVVSLTIKGPRTVLENDGARYTCTASYSDGSAADASSSAAWSENAGCTTINGDGYLTAGDVTADQPCRITAAYAGHRDDYDITISDQVRDTVMTPMLTPDGGSYTDDRLNVTVSCGTPDAIIRYTLNGVEPDESADSVDSSRSLDVPVPITIKAKAWKAGMTPSPTRTAVYSISSLTPGEICLGASDYRATEGKKATIIVKRMNGADGVASVAFITKPKAALAWQDYKPRHGTLTWRDGESASKAVTVGILADHMTEGQETFQFVLKNPVGATLASPKKSRIIIQPNTKSGPVQEDPTAARMVQLTAALGGEGLTWFTSSREPWTGQTDAAASGGIVDSQASWLETELEGPGRLEFNWVVNGAGADACLVFNNGNVLRALGSGYQWSHEVLKLGQGDHTVRWVFVGDSGVSTRAAILDQVKWIPDQGGRDLGIPSSADD